MTDTHTIIPDSNALHSTWHDNLYDSLHCRLRWSFLLNGGLLLALVLVACALLVLLPLKTTVPFVISHNKTTGEITQLGQLNPADYATDWTLTRYFLMRYITSRESFHQDNIELPYQTTCALSDKAIAQTYEAMMQESNPASPLNQYGKKSFITVTIHSMAALNDNTAEVHFEKIQHDKDSGQETRQSLVAIVKWRYDNMKTTQSQRDKNPLGFQVTYYQPTYVNIN